MKKLWTLGFTLWFTILYGQNSCEYYEDKFEVFFESDFDIEEAQLLFDKYSALECSDMLVAYNFIGFAHYNISNFEEAKAYLLKGENDFFNEENKQEQFAINQMYAGLVLIAQKEYQSALYHLNKAENHISNETKAFVRATIFQNKGLVNVEIGDLNLAEQYFDKSIQTGGLDSLAIGYIYQNLAFLNLKREDAKKTREYIDRTAQVWNDLEFSKGIYFLSFIQAKFEISKKEFNKALYHLDEGRARYKNEDKLLLGENYLIEAQIHDSLKNAEAKLLALENAILESEDLTAEQLNEAILDYTKLQDKAKMNMVIAKLVSRLKTQNINQNKNQVARNKLFDSEYSEGQSMIRTQLKYLIMLGALVLLLFYLFIRTKKQKSSIQYLNTNLQSSKLEIENQVEKLKQKNKDLEQFAYVASHDLKSPLRTISSFAGLLKKKKDSDEPNEYLDIIINSAQNMSSMISELLRYSTLDQKLNIQKINLAEIIQDTTQRISTQIKESQAVIKINDNCNQIIQCDKSLFINVFQNLISNSIIYCKAGEAPQISVTAFEKNNNIEIKITDNGIGMDKAHSDQIFEMFTRLKTKDVDGTGIGLATCRKIVENHQGTITVDSTVGVGSTFSIRIPFIEGNLYKLDS